MMQIYFPGKLVFGNGSLSGLSGEVMALRPSRVFIVTIMPLVGVLQGFVSDLEAKGLTVFVHTGIVQEPSFADFNQLMLQAAPFDPDVVIGIGGGSVLDVAKMVAAQLDNEQTLDEYVGIGLLKGRAKKLICVPATSGTGSEVSPNAILVDDRDNQKKGFISPFLVPDIVYVDPLLTVSVPPAITAATGLDALTHCLEAYTNKFAKPFIDLYAYEGMRLIAAHLVKAVQDGGDVEARSQVAMGSLLGGFCLGPVNTAADRYADVAVALGCTREEDTMFTALKGVEKIRTLIRECGIPSTLKEVGISLDAIPEMAVAAMKITRLLNNNPRPVELNDAIAIYKAAF